MFLLKYAMVLPFTWKFLKMIANFYFNFTPTSNGFSTWELCMVFFNGQFYVWVIASQKDSKISGWFYFLQMCVYLNISYTSVPSLEEQCIFSILMTYIFSFMKILQRWDLLLDTHQLTENTHSVVHFNSNFLVRRWIRTRTHYFINFMFIKIY